MIVTELDLSEITRPTTLEVIAAAKKRDDVVPEYANCILEEDDYYPQDWKAINAAIIEKWSVSALVYIKEKAWKRAEEYRGMWHDSLGFAGTLHA